MRNRALVSLALCGLIPLAIAAAAPPAKPAAGKDGRPEVVVTPDLRERTVLCTDGKSHYVAIGPEDTSKELYTTIYYGNGKLFYEVPGYGGLTRTLFRDPRYYNQRAPHDEGRTDFRLLAGVKHEKGQCSVWCGERDTQLSVVEPHKAAALLKGAKFEASPQLWRPYALVRDDRGVYYYVDRGNWPATAKHFRLFVGTKGNLKLQKMTNVVSDSEGDIFATTTGSLRLILSKHESSWIEGDKTRKLTIVPLDENEGHASNILMVYNELGVYAGERLGTPCDDL